MRSIWKGHIRFSLVTIPINIYSSNNSKGNISFDQLHDEDNGKISYRRVCNTCDEVVEYKDIVKGYEYQPDQYVVLSKEDMNSIKLKSERAIDIEAFVDIDEVHPSRFEAVYYLGPSDTVAQKTFNLFYTTLQKTNKAGIGRLVLREKEDVVLLAPQKGAIVLYKLRYPYELKNIEDVPNIDNVDVDEAQLQLAETLVASLTKSFDEVNFDDRYRESLLKLIDSKVEGKEIVHVAEAEDDVPVVDIMDALKKSIEDAKKKAG